MNLVTSDIDWDNIRYKGVFYLQHYSEEGTGSWLRTESQSNSSTKVISNWWVDSSDSVVDSTGSHKSQFTFNWKWYNIRCRDYKFDLDRGKLIAREGYLRQYNIFDAERKQLTLQLIENAIENYAFQRSRVGKEINNSSVKRIDVTTAKRHYQNNWQPHNWKALLCMSLRV